MQDGHFIVNVHEHPGDHAAENNARMGICCPLSRLKR